MKHLILGLILLSCLPGCSGGLNKAPRLETAAVVGTYQAESASLGGGAKVESNNSGYTGSGFVNFAASGSYASWNNVSVSAAGSYTLSFRYALSSGSRTVALKVNGTSVSGGLTFASTGVWTTWRTVSVTVSLKAGSNTVRLETTGQDAGNVDRLEVATPSTATVTVVAAGDIACDPASGSFNGGAGTSGSCHMKATSDLIDAAKPDAVLVLGDNQYASGTLTQFKNAFDLSWGRFKSLIRPAVGNHEYATSGASGYFDYFGSGAGDPAKGYYSYDLGAWHIVALNSNCSQVGGCGVGSPQEQWLRTDLAANSAKCTLAYAHHPRYSSGSLGNTSALRDLWQALYDDGAELMLSGHDHHYERFAPQDASGRADARGVRQFVVGTGGKDLGVLKDIKANSQVQRSDTYGVLKLTLNADNYAWTFLPEAGKTFTDSGSASCN